MGGVLLKKNLVVKFILTMVLGTIITTSVLKPFGGPGGGEPPDPEMATIEYNINI